MIRRYKVNVETDEKGWVKVTIPTISSINAEAHTREQALQFAAAAVTIHLKSLSAAGGKIPESDVDAIVVDI